MTAKALIKQSDLKRLAAVAKEYGVRIEVEIEGMILRIAPNRDDPQIVKEQTHFAGANTFEGWKNRNNTELTSSKRNPLDIPFHERPPGPIQPRFDHREERAMEHLAAVGADIPIDWYTLKNFGRHTQQKLAGRGYIEVSAETDRQGNPTELWLTKAGQKAMRDLDMHRSKYPVL
ncbi:hypothetical protein [Ensifer aridi]|uniref:hypothetical protein n=1 Tax=Ensifer aridi TaxID=1708715 RepID=UPI000A105559|nr:hypothetical protein [Ensifer aridi]